jgi:hemoglobin/transferrin/lactoferrin receptor protein
MKPFLLSLALVLITNTLWSQKVKVVDETDLQPISDVFIFSKANSALTDENGFGDLDQFSATEVLVFQHPSYVTRSLTKSEIIANGSIVKLHEDLIRVNEIVVSQNRWEQDKAEIPNKIEAIRSKDVSFYNPQTTADLVGLSDQVFIQKSQLGGGSPMIRGFSANRVLLSVDGIRLNNAIYRSGNLQNIIMLDPNVMDNSEIIFGPGSVIYGSDAIGGVMDFHTRDAKLSTTDKHYIKANTLTRYSSANQEKSGHLDFSYGQKQWGILSSISFSDYGDLRMGNEGEESYELGSYVKVMPDRDTVLINPDKAIQVGSSYSQVNMMQKLRYRPSEKIDLNYAFHYSRSSDVPRFDRLVEISKNEPKYAEWYYGPTKWLMHRIGADISNHSRLFDHLRFSMAYQSYEESRHDRKLGSEKIRERYEYVDIMSINLDADKSLAEKHELFYGLEYTTNDVVSQGISRNIYTGALASESSRYPDGGTSYLNSGIYAGTKSKVREFLVISTGLRANYVSLNSLFVDKTFFDFPYDEISMDNMAFNGSIGFTYRPFSLTQINVNVSSGFRAPNLDDVGKVFDSEPGNVVVPNEDLKPEYAINADIGIIQRSGEQLKIEVTGFYTYLFNAMVRRDFEFNGSDSILYDGELSNVQALVNTDEAFVYGFSAALSWNIVDYLFFKSSVSGTFGEELGGIPLRHAAPMFGASHLIFQKDKLKADFFVRYNGAKPHSKMAPSELSKIYMYAMDEVGDLYSPSWYTLNFSFAYQIRPFLQLNLGVENILDRRYRPYSSGISAPGRNLMLTMRTSL